MINNYLKLFAPVAYKQDEQLARTEYMQILNNLVEDNFINMAPAKLSKLFWKAHELHYTQTRYNADTGSYEPYFNHLLRVAFKAVAYARSFNNFAGVSDIVKDELDRMVWLTALFHDSLEDTYATFDELTFLLGSDVAQTVRLLTHEEGVKYSDYILKIVAEGEFCALLVKYADIEDNSVLNPFIAAWVDKKTFDYCVNKQNVYAKSKAIIFHAIQDVIKEYKETFNL